MIVPQLHIWLTLPLLIGLVMLCYFTGAFFCYAILPGKKNSFFSDQDAEPVFWKLFSGFLLLLSLYAIYTTRFQTILLPVPLLLFFLFRWKKNHPIVQADNSTALSIRGNTVLLIILSILLYWAFFAYLFFPTDATTTSYIGYDSAFYGRASSFMNLTGKEITTLDHTGLSSSALSPYHYADLWSGAFLERLTGWNSTLLTSTVVYPFLAMLFVLGLLAYTRSFFNYTNSNPAEILLIGGGLLNGFFFILSPFFPGSAMLFSSLVSNPKLIMVACITIGILLCLKKGYLNHCLLLITAALLLYTPAAPSIMVTAILVLLYGTLLKKIKLKECLPGLGVVILCLLYFLLFYHLFPSGQKETAEHSLPAYNLSTAFHILLAGLAQYGLLLPFFLLLLFTGPGKRSFTRLLQPDLLFLCLLPLTGLVCWALFYRQTYDSVQLFQNVFPVAAAIITILIVAKILRTNNWWLKIAAMVLVVSSIVLNYKFDFDRRSIPNQDLAAIRTFLGKHPAGLFVNLRTPAELSSVYERNTSAIQPLVFLDYLLPRYQNISLNAPFLEIDPAYLYAKVEREHLATAPFSVYLREQGAGLTPGEYMLHFIKDKNARFLSVSPGAEIPLALRQILDDSLLISSNNWRIYHLAR